MKSLCIILITSFSVSFMWRSIHKCPVSESEKVSILMKGITHRDSLLNLWFNDYTWRMRVMAGVEKDTSVTKYQKWNSK